MYFTMPKTLDHALMSMRTVHLIDYYLFATL